jgi:hypothetical protein
LEPDLLHPLASGGQVERYAFKPLSDVLLFPYRRAADGMHLLTEPELAGFPKTAEYLRSHENVLRSRENGRFDTAEWYAFGRRQNLGLHDLPKLGVAATVARLEIALDKTGEVYFHNVRVNGILPNEDGPSLLTLLVLLNSTLLDWVFKLGAAEHANGHYAANKQFIAPLPIRTAATDVENSLAELGASLHENARALMEERAGFLSWLSDLVGTPVTSLEGCTRLENPDQLTPAEIIEILGVRRNRDRLTIDPSSRPFRESLVKEHRESLEKIAEFSNSIQRDEAEADAATFDLYEVSNSHREMVEAAYDL